MLFRSSVTGRERRAAPFNFDLARRAINLNGATEIALTKVDIRFPKIKGKRKWTKLGEEPKEFIRSIEEETGLPVNLISTGPKVEDIIFR